MTPTPPIAWTTPEVARAVMDVNPSVFHEHALPLDKAQVYRAYSAVGQPRSVRVVILGQDPYPAPGKANGLAFGIAPDFAGQRIRSSMGSLFKVLTAAGHIPGGAMDATALRRWCTLEHLPAQGVLLTNTRLTVEAGHPGSHFGFGWEAVVRALLDQVPADARWLCWGAEATAVARRAGARHVHNSSHPCSVAASRATSRRASFLSGAWLKWLDAEGIEINWNPEDLTCVRGPQTSY